MDSIVKLQNMIDESNNIVFFGGAGVSTDSGIKDFRGSNGLYKDNPEYLLSAECFYNEPKKFYEFYKNNLNSLNVEPNVTHKYLFKLENKGKLKAIITQNIDGLHTNAGNKNVYEIHGTIMKNYCTMCNKEYDAKYIFESNSIPICTCGSIIKPAVVLYGEMLPQYEYDMSINSIKSADLLIVAGTSLRVEPACSMIKLFKGKYLVIINNEPTKYDMYADLVIHDNLKNIFSKLK